MPQEKNGRTEQNILTCDFYQLSAWLEMLFALHIICIYLEMKSEDLKGTWVEVPIMHNFKLFTKPSFKPKDNHNGWPKKFNPDIKQGIWHYFKTDISHIFAAFHSASKIS